MIAEQGIESAAVVQASARKTPQRPAPFDWQRCTLLFAEETSQELLDGIAALPKGSSQNENVQDHERACLASGHCVT